MVVKLTSATPVLEQRCRNFTTCLKIYKNIDDLYLVEAITVKMIQTLLLGDFIAPFVFQTTASNTHLGLAAFIHQIGDRLSLTGLTFSFQNPSHPLVALLFYLRTMA
jgi:hypothetical protein